jgi:hypothetical protein
MVKIMRRFVLIIDLTDDDMVELASARNVAVNRVGVDVDKKQLFP